VQSINQSIRISANVCVVQKGLMEFAGVDKAARSKTGVENAGVDNAGVECSN